MNTTDSKNMKLSRFECAPRDMNIKNDKLERAQHVLKFKEILKNTKGPYVFAVTAGWGMGKTYFINSIINEMKQPAEKYPCVYFNAWENDFCNDPLVSLFGNIRRELIDNNYIEEDYIKNVTEIACNIIKDSPKIVGGAVAGVLKHKIGGVAFEYIRDGIIDPGAQILSQYLKSQKNRKNFTKELSEVSAKIKDRFGKNLIIFIDELDRCKPDYAISFLEHIKHLFNIEGIVFVLSLDGEQFLNIVENTFGFKKIDVDGHITDNRMKYLGKFIDLFYALPNPHIHPFITNQMKMQQVQLPNDWPLNGENGHLKVDFFDVLAFGCVGMNKSLRDFQQKIAKFSILTRCQNLPWNEQFIIFDMIMKQKDDLYFVGDCFRVRYESRSALIDSASTKIVDVDNIIIAYKCAYCVTFYCGMPNSSLVHRDCVERTEEISALFEDKQTKIHDEGFMKRMHDNVIFLEAFSV